MDFADVVKMRTSIRSFLSQEVDEFTLRELCRVGGMAPSVNNFQPWRFVAVANQQLLTRIADVIARKIQELPHQHETVSELVKRQVEYFSTFFEKAPAVIFIFISPSESVLEKGIGFSHEEVNRMRSYPDMQSVGACVQNILLAAVNSGLGACWLSSSLIAKEEIAQILGICDGAQLASMVVVGYPRTNVPPRTKKEIDTIFEFVR